MSVNGTIGLMSYKITLDRLAKKCTDLHVNALQPSHPACVVINV